MKPILASSFSYTPGFETDLARKFNNVRRVQEMSVTPHPSPLVYAGTEITTAANTPYMKQGDINHYAALNQLGLSFAHRRLSTEL